MIRKIGIGVAGLVALLGVSLAATYMLTMPQPLPENSSSSEWLETGPYSVGILETEFVDDERPTDENGDYAGAANRSFPTNIWFPENAEGRHPLIIHSHGFVSSRTDLSYAASHLASYGYIVVAADYPLTSGGAPGGPNANDLINQPDDVSFLIDSVLELSGSNKPFSGEIDTSRIGLMGYSLGGLTSTLASYHPRLRDERISAAISIAGPSAALAKKFYQTTDIPFLMIAGTLDALVDFRANAAVIPERVGNSALLEIAGGTHLGFSSMAEPLFRLLHHPDGFGCSAVLSNLDEDPNAAFTVLGTEADGIVIDSNTPAVCQTMPTEKALHPGRQRMATTIAVLSFFESVFADDQASREAALDQLSHSLPADMPEVTYSR
ncbi:MAG: hypothetical protein COA96_08560 [SAR86 cluster bacterium]|uniref:PET hydrolase/cutinase-like domain-containing protein n=1 Tax=SAR86 cluster bacterium TaxID=2030880 RepID=A0A2A5B080_9GAMM|nr:MAG: hypothetical protein COA96_08560 [SAR86 cluster bacterium]